MPILSPNLLLYFVNFSNLSTKFLKRIRNCLSPKDEFFGFQKWVDKRFQNEQTKEGLFSHKKVQNQIKLPDIPIIGENTDGGSLLGMKCRKYGFGAYWIEVSLYDSDSMRQIGVSTRCIWFEKCIDNFPWSIFIVWDFNFSCWYFGVIISHWYDITYIRSCGIIHISRYRSESVSEITIPIRRCYWESWIRLLWSCSISGRIWWKIIHRCVNSREHQERTNCADPFMNTSFLYRLVRRRFHTFTKRAN